MKQLTIVTFLLVLFVLTGHMAVLALLAVSWAFLARSALDIYFAGEELAEIPNPYRDDR